MFETLKYKIGDFFERIFNEIQKNREQQKQKIIAKRNAYLEQQRRKNNQKAKEEIKEYNQKIKESQMQLRRTFTTIEEYKKIAGPKLCRLNDLPEDEREMVVRRVQKLCKEDEIFRKSLMVWARQNYEIPKKAGIQKNYSNQNTISI